MLQIPPPSRISAHYDQQGKLDELLPAIAPEEHWLFWLFVEPQTEIVRVFDIREGAVRAVIETARQAS
jgi:hypothetical protein